MKTSQRGIDLIKQYEGLSLTQYICPADKPTIGYGHVILPGETFRTPLNRLEAEELLRADLKRFEDCINDAVTTDLHQNGFDALVCLVFNIGCSAFRKSTMLKFINADDFTGAAKQFDRWVYASGHKLEGLVRRRKAERDLWEDMA
jgi:lysozyme